MTLPNKKSLLFNWESIFIVIEDFDEHFTLYSLHDIWIKFAVIQLTITWNLKSLFEKNK